jgi:hypothetical protein
MASVFSRPAPAAPPSEPGAAATPAASTDVQCPAVEIRQGASTMSFSQTGVAADDPTALALRYQVTIGRTARDCVVRENMLTIRIGMEGRLILGPAGGPGQIEVPLRYALVREGPEPKMITTKLHRVPVVIPPGQGNIIFTHVEDDLTVPMPSATDLDGYVIYLGFDPNVPTPQEEKKKKPKSKPKPQRPA